MVHTMLETHRLTLRPPRRIDIPKLFEFLGDAVAMQHTHSDRTLGECRRRILVHEWRRRRDGSAPWVVERRDDGRIIGWGGLYEDPFDPGWDFEIGYYFRRDAWGKGYASELVGAALQIADQQLKLPEVWAMVHPDNTGSKRVLEKAGFLFNRHLPDRNRKLFLRRRSPQLS